MKFDWIVSCIILASIGLGGCNSGPDAPSDAQPTAAHDDDPEPIEIHRHAGFLVSGQPDEQALRDIAGEGVGTLINCRSVEETDELAFDQASLASELGMNYVHVPTGGDDGYSPEQLAAFTQAVRDAKGPVYVHCASGGRARLLIMGHLIRHEGMSVDEAMRVSRELGGREPALDRLLGETVRYGLTDRDIAPSSD